MVSIKQLSSNSNEDFRNYNPYDLLRIYTYYRTLLGGILLLMFELEFAPKVFGDHNPRLFFYTSAVYTAINFLTLALMWRLSFLPSQSKLFGSLLIDVIAIGLLMHASGGATSSLGYLVLIAVAAGGIMLSERISFFLAAITTLFVLTEGTFRFYFIEANNSVLFASSTLSTLAFVTALLFQHLTKKIRVSYEEAKLQTENAAHLQNLAHLIVERMRTGIFVVNKNLNIELYNQSALKLLGGPQQSNEHPVNHHSLSLDQFPELHQKYLNWWAGMSGQSPFLTLHGTTTTEIKVNFAYLGQKTTSEVLIFMEDVRALNQQAQQLKLASLGRLTASIAHEIRNPLGAISHANQLLNESTAIPDSEQRLLEIISNHSKRVNHIIENVLQLSRRRPANPSPINLRTWIPQFIHDYQASKPEGHTLKIEVLDKSHIATKEELNAKFDPSQLQQVLTNLCDNGIRYSAANQEHPHLRIEIGIDIQQQQPYIRVVDFGAGILETNSKHLFEPFYTTENTGSGLGLYICKELCEANQAIIFYRRTELNESCFQIQLAHPNKII
jgi:two-component system, NtrC family, sensor histidine kinase PilS